VGPQAEAAWADELEEDDYPSEEGCSHQDLGQGCGHTLLLPPGESAWSPCGLIDSNLEVRGDEGGGAGEGWQEAAGQQHTGMAWAVLHEWSLQ
jgi:hypothetical protein